jgi:putative transposase
MDWPRSSTSATTSALMHRHLRRLERVCVDSPIYFITTYTKDRRAVLARDDVANILIEEWSAARDRHGWVIGRYVIMPDHVHFFCRPEYEAQTLPKFVGTWKSWTSRKINNLVRPRSATAATTPLWQREFFDHVLRSGESYSEKWSYDFNNPMHAGLVSSADDWKYAGEIETLML